MRRMLAVFMFLALLAPTPCCVAKTIDPKAVSNVETSTAQADPETIEDSELTPVGGTPCNSESSLKSLNSDTRTFLRFRNATSRDVTYYWINFDGKRDQKRTLKPGEGYSLWTYLTHPFVVADANGKCAMVYMPQKQYGLAIITDAK